MIMSETYKEPNYSILMKNGNIEIREYGKYVIAKTSTNKDNADVNSNMFRVLAGYIFGGNSEGKSMPMTAPVVTQENISTYDMIFFMLDASDTQELPSPNSQDITIEEIEIGKTISIRFGMWATDKRVGKFKRKLDRYIEDNSIAIKSSIMIAQYNSPWAVPPFRKNELIYKIN